MDRLFAQTREDGGQEPSSTADPIKEILKGFFVAGQIREEKGLETGSNLFVSVEAPQVGDLKRGLLVITHHGARDFRDRFQRQASASDDHPKGHAVVHG